MPRGVLLGGGLALLVVCGLAAKMGMDFVALERGAGAAPISAASGDKTAPAKTPVVVSGFRSAHFGDDEAAVRKAIEVDFGVSGDKVIEGRSAIEKTRLLAVRVKDLVADTGTAEIQYVLGYKTEKLIQVNVVMGTQLSPETSPAALGAAASLLGRHFADMGFDPKTVTINDKLSNGALRVFNGRDLEGHLVTLLFQEAEIKTTRPADDTAAAKKQAAKDKAGEAAKDAPEVRRVAGVRLTYVADPDNPDIYKIEPGKF
jgi:hypothetical protein